MPTHLRTPNPSTAACASVTSLSEDQEEDDQDDDEEDNSSPDVDAGAEHEHVYLRLRLSEHPTGLTHSHVRHRADSETSLQALLEKWIAGTQTGPRNRYGLVGFEYGSNEVEAGVSGALEATPRALSCRLSAS